MHFIILEVYLFALTRASIPKPLFRSVMDPCHGSSISRTDGAAWNIKYILLHFCIFEKIQEHCRILHSFFLVWGHPHTTQIFIFILVQLSSALKCAVVWQPISNMAGFGAARWCASCCQFTSSSLIGWPQCFWESDCTAFLFKVIQMFLVALIFQSLWDSWHWIFGRYLSESPQAQSYIQPDFRFVHLK